MTGKIWYDMMRMMIMMKKEKVMVRITKTGNAWRVIGPNGTFLTARLSSKAKAQAIADNLNRKFNAAK